MKCLGELNLVGITADNILQPSPLMRNKQCVFHSILHRKCIIWGLILSIPDDHSYVAGIAEILDYAVVESKDVRWWRGIGWEG